MTEEGASRSCRQHKVVIAVSLAAEDDLLVFSLDLSDFTKQHLHIALASNQLPQRSRYITTGDQSRRNLIEQRLEQIEVAFVDQGDANVCLGQSLAGTNTRKSAAHNDDVGRVSQTLFGWIQLEVVMLSSHGYNLDNLNSAYGCQTVLSAPSIT